MSVCNTDVKQKAAPCEHYNFNIFQFLKSYRKQSIQFSFAALAFITFGIGDGITSAYMIHINGIMVEANPLIRSIVESHGLLGLIFYKMYMTFMLLTVIVLLEKTSKEPSYWTANGLFAALAIGGVMATTANLMQVYGFEVLGHGVPAPNQVIAVYLILTVFFLTVGEYIDNIQKSRKVQDFMSTYSQDHVKENPTIISDARHVAKDKPMLTNVIQNRIS